MCVRRVHAQRPTPQGVRRRGRQPDLDLNDDERTHEPRGSHVSVATRTIWLPIAVVAVATRTLRLMVDAARARRDAKNRGGGCPWATAAPVRRNLSGSYRSAPEGADADRRTRT